MALNVPAGGRALLLASVGAAALTVAIALMAACGGGEDAPAGGAEGKLSLGGSTELTSATIGEDGGAITIDRPDDPLHGLELTVPAGSYPDKREFRVSSRPITSHSYDGRINPISPLISIENGGDYAGEIMALKVPVKVPEGQFAMGFFYDEETGALEGMPLLAEDGSSVTIGTRHFSDFFISSLLESVLLNTTVDSGFRPGVDDWQFENNGSYAARVGHCAGQSISAIWYYYQRKLSGETDLYGRYDNYLSDEEKTPDLWEDDNLAYRLASTVQKDIHWDALSAALPFAAIGADDTLQLLSFAYAFHVTHKPQLVGLIDSADGGGHAVVAYRIDRGTIWIADPNFPGVKSAEGKIEYVNGAFKPYRSALSAKSDPTSFDRIGYLAVTAFVNWEAVGARFAEMEDGAVGDEYFPAYTVPGGSAETTGVVLLADGVAFPDDRLVVHLPDIGWKVTAFRDGEELPKVGGFVTLLPGENKLGILVERDGLYVDFYRVAVIYNQVTISPDPITGNAGDDLEITATMPAQVADARFEWDYGDGTPKENLTQQAMHVFAEEGEYPVTVNVYDEKDRLIGRGKAAAKIGPATASHTAATTPVAACTWAGIWNTDAGKMTFTQTGNSVTGTYIDYPGQGEITGTVSGNTLSGTWTNFNSGPPDRNSGGFLFTMEPGCRFFDGTFGLGTDNAGPGLAWDGDRVPPTGTP